MLSTSADNLLESVEDELSTVELKSRVEDGVRDPGGVAELRRETTDLASHAQNLLPVKPEKTFFDNF